MPNNNRLTSVPFPHGHGRISSPSRGFRDRS
jgi:hypothetical protein